MVLGESSLPGFQRATVSRGPRVLCTWRCLSSSSYKPTVAMRVLPTRLTQTLISKYHHLIMVRVRASTYKFGGGVYEHSGHNTCIGQMTRCEAWYTQLFFPKAHAECASTGISRAFLKPWQEQKDFHSRCYIIDALLPGEPGARTQQAQTQPPGLGMEEI